MINIDLIKDGDYYIECNDLENATYDVYNIHNGKLGLEAYNVSEEEADKIVWNDFRSEECRIVFKRSDSLYRLEYWFSEVEGFYNSGAVMQPTINIIMKRSIEDFLKEYADLKRSHSSLESQFADHNEMIDKGDPSNEDKLKAFKDKIDTHNKIAKGLELDYNELIKELDQYNIPDDIKKILHQKEGFITPKSYIFHPKM